MTMRACPAIGGQYARRYGSAEPRGRGLPTRGIRPPLHSVLALALALVLLALAGCSRSERPPLGNVSGTVTLDGTPLAGALVVFTPDGPGRSAIATTDAAGRYQLSFLRDIAGANVGTHTVRITTATEDRGGKEILPSRYHAKTELKATVKSGTNTLDFTLQSK